jgi:hypothetical protein
MFKKLFFVIAVMSSCKTPKLFIDYKSFNITKEELGEISLKAVFTSALDKEDDPIDEVNSYTLGSEKKRVMCYFTWFELTASKQYYIKLKWYSPTNELYEQNDYIFTPREPTWYTWHYLYLRSSLTPKGVYKVKVFLNNAQMKELSVTIN